MRPWPGPACVAVLLSMAGVAQAQEPGLTQVLRIGVVDGAPEYTFNTIADVAFGPDDSIYVLDARNAVVRVFDADGRHLRSFGRSGEGPGEMRFPTRLIVGSNRVLVVDPVQRRVVAFTLGGDHLDTRRMEAPAAGADNYAPLRHGFWLVSRSAVGSEFGPLVRLPPARIRSEAPAARQRGRHFVALWQEGTIKVDTLMRFDHGSVFFINPDRPSYGPLGARWEPGGAWTVGGDSLVALVDAYEGHVRILRATPSGLATVRSGRVPLTPQPLTEREWRELEAVQRQDRNLPPSIVLSGPPFRGQLGSPVLAADGTLWVSRITFDPRRRGNPAPPSWIVVPVDGRAQYTLQGPPGFLLRAVRGDLLAGVTVDAMGVHRLEVWRAPAPAGPARPLDRSTPMALSR